MDPSSVRKTPIRTMAPKLAVRQMPSITCWRLPGRVGVDLTLDDWDRCGREVATICQSDARAKPDGKSSFTPVAWPCVLKGGLGERVCCTRMRSTVQRAHLFWIGEGAINNNETVDPARSTSALTQKRIAV